ncbi:MAG: tripartite tricarboxylate transporter substrate binding protein [Burkholderiales bacterium]
MSQPTLSLLVCAITLAGVNHAALAQRADDAARAYPSRPVRMVIGFTPGGQPDIVARLIAPRLGEALGQQFVIDNRPGAGGVVGTKIVVDALPDGYTLLTTSSSHAITPAVYAKLPFDTLKDIAGVSMTSTAAYVLAVSPSLGVKSVQEFVTLAKAKPGQFNYSSAGNGSGTHFAGEMFKQAAQIDVVHIPYKGVPEALTDTIGGRVQFVMAPLGSSVSLVREGRLRGLAVSTAKRVSVHPDIPTIAETGYPGFRWDSWGGVFAPAKVPRAIINKLNRDIVRILNEPDIQQRMNGLGMESMPSSPEQLDKFVADQIAVVMQLAKKAGIQAK